MSTEEYSKKRVVDLKKILKEKGHTGISKYRKDELIYLLVNGTPPLQRKKTNKKLKNKNNARIPKKNKILSNLKLNDNNKNKNKKQIYNLRLNIPLPSIEDNENTSFLITPQLTRANSLPSKLVIAPLNNKNNKNDKNNNNKNDKNNNKNDKNNNQNNDKKFTTNNDKLITHCCHECCGKKYGLLLGTIENENANVYLSSDDGTNSNVETELELNLGDEF